MTKTPRIGLLGITQELYDDVVVGITDYQRRFGNELVSWFKDDLTLVYPGPAKNRAQIEQTMERFNQEGLDGIMIVMLTYAPSLWGVNAYRNNRLPLLLANLQPERTVSRDWDMNSLTYNQGIHGIQDLANCLFKLGIKPPVITGDWKSASFRTQLVDWAHASRTICRMRTSRIATFGQMPGMGDITADPNDLMRVLGPQVDHVHVGVLHDLMGKVSTPLVEEAMERDHRNFEVAGDLPRENHAYAARLYLGLKEFLVSRGYDGFCVHFDALGEDGRFKQIHMLAASNLMAEGFGYAAEGDVICASLMVAGHTIAGDAHFTEMYALDYERNAILMSHMGEGNWKVARRGRKPRLIKRELRIGGLDDPPTVLFSAEPGETTLVSLANLGAGRFRMVAMEGTILDEAELPKIEMPYFFLRPKKKTVEETASLWLENAGTHHQVLNLGNRKARWNAFCRLSGIEFVDLT
jgi:L-arabinose isomerase